MNDIDDLRAAMQTTPDFEPQPLDLDLVMAQGGRLRRRRRVATGTASGVAVLALLVGGAQLARREPAAQPAGGPPAATMPSATATASAATDPRPAPSDDPGAKEDVEVIGDVIDTGIVERDGERVMWLSPVPSDPGLPFMVVTGRRAANGALSADVVNNETDGSGREPGFHACEGAMEVNGRDTPAFGYYVGPAKRITARAGGKRVVADQATSSEDPSIIVFWFAPDLVKPDVELTGLTAYDRKGRKLPAGNPTFAVG